MTELVGCVITTTGREELLDAVMSALVQTVPTRVAVVVDNPAREAYVRQLTVHLDITVVATAGYLGGGAARNVGIAALRDGCSYIAFLDDDDYWLPNKLERQITMLSSSAARITSCQALFVNIRRGTVRKVPRRPPRPTERISSYVLNRTRLRYGTSFLQTSTLLVRTKDLPQMAWREDIPKHQDWDYVIKATGDDASNVVIVPEVLAVIRQGTSGSVSRKTDWAASLRWVESIQPSVDDRTKSDFAATHIIRSALANRDREGLMEGLKIWRKKPPHLAAALLSMASLPYTIRGVPKQSGK